MRGWIACRTPYCVVTFKVSLAVSMPIRHRLDSSSGEIRECREWLVVAYTLIVEISRGRRSGVYPSPHVERCALYESVSGDGSGVVEWDDDMSALITIWSPVWLLLWSNSSESGCHGLSSVITRWRQLLYSSQLGTQVIVPTMPLCTSKGTSTCFSPGSVMPSVL